MQQTHDCKLITQLDLSLQNWIGLLPYYRWSCCKYPDAPLVSIVFHQLENIGSGCNTISSCTTKVNQANDGMTILQVLSRSFDKYLCNTYDTYECVCVCSKLLAKNFHLVLHKEVQKKIWNWATLQCIKQAQFETVSLCCYCRLLS